MDQLDKLDKMMLVVSVLGLVINVVQIYAISNHSWLEATALADGQPFNAYLSLGSATFGTPDDPSRDNKYFCSSYEAECSLRTLCSKDTPEANFPNGSPRFTPQEAWCQVLSAGSLATRFLFFGLLLGLGATGFTGMYSAQAIPWVAQQFDQIEEMGFIDEYQKYIIGGGWAALWVFLFASMITYSATIPDSLGWGTVQLESSFGLLRSCFVLASVQCALVANTIFHFWENEVALDAWKAFMATPWLSFKKALYIELTLQLVAYFFYVVVELDWASMLVVLAWVYLSGGDRSFMIMYATFIVVSILFDVIKIAELPAFNQMTSGEAFGAWTWLIIFTFKPIIVGTMIAYDILERNQPDEGGEDAHKWTQFNEQGLPGPDDDEVLDDEKVAC